MLRAIDVAWAAGFIEGEGHMARGNKKTVMPKITAVQVQREPLERLQSMFGGGIYPRKARTPRESDAWVWFQSGRPAVEICLTIYGLMSPKRRSQIDKALKAWRASPVRRENHSERCPNGHVIAGANARTSSYYKDRIYTTCRQCEAEKNDRRHSLEMWGEALVPLPKHQERAKGDAVTCFTCGGEFIARRWDHVYCQKKCAGAARTKLLAERRAAALKAA